MRLVVSKEERKQYPNIPPGGVVGGEGGGGRGLSLIWSKRVCAAEQVNRGWFS